jgi:hypothetical protein
VRRPTLPTYLCEQLCKPTLRPVKLRARRDRWPNGTLVHITGPGWWAGRCRRAGLECPSCRKDCVVEGGRVVELPVVYDIQGP